MTTSEQPQAYSPSTPLQEFLTTAGLEVAMLEQEVATAHQLLLQRVSTEQVARDPDLSFRLGRLTLGQEWLARLVAIIGEQPVDQKTI